MSIQENKRIVRQFWSKDPDQEIARALLAEDFVNHSPAPGFSKDKEGFLQLLAMYYQALPDHTITIDDMLAQGDEVVTRWTVRGTHQGEMMGVPSTGNTVEVTGITINRLRDGQIVAQWQCEDTLGMMQQIGAVPAPQEAPA